MRRIVSCPSLFLILLLAAPPVAAQAESARPASPRPSATTPSSAAPAQPVPGAMSSSRAGTEPASEAGPSEPLEPPGPDAPVPAPDPTSAPTLGGEPDSAPSEADDADASTPTLDPSDEAVLAAMDEPDGDGALSQETVLRHERELLQRDLTAVDRELTDTSTLLPSLALGLGLAATVTGAALGAGKSLFCERADDGCAASAAAGVLVVSGLVVSSTGFLWWYWTSDDQRELRSKRYHLAQKLEWNLIQSGLE